MNTRIQPTLVRDSKELVQVIDGKVVVTSVDIAKRFGKIHRNVMRDIRNLECSEEFRLLNFEQSSYITSQNKVLQCYQVTRDGFSILAMGFTGVDAMKFKEAYIIAFNAMERSILETIKHISVMDDLNLLAKVASDDKDIASIAGKTLNSYKKVKAGNIKKLDDAYKQVQKTFDFYDKNKKGDDKEE